MAKKAKTAARIKSRSRSVPVVDTHTHIIIPDVWAMTKKHSLPARTGAGSDNLSATAIGQDKTMLRMTDAKTRIKDMDRMGIDMQVISPSLVHQESYWASPKKGLEIDQLSNQRMAEYVGAYPDRFAGIGSVPLQDGKLAAKELDRLVNKLGLRGVGISTQVGKLELGDKSLWPFWRKAEKLGVPVFIHPAGNDDIRMHRFGFAFTLAQPWEEAMAMASLVYDGIMDKFPKVKIQIAHGGGYLPYYSGRLDNGYAQMRKRGQTTNLKHKFSGYLKKFYYDSVIFDVDMLEFLTAKIPASRVMMGTDYPFGETRPIQFVQKSKKISRADKDAILGGTAAKMFRLGT